MEKTLAEKTVTTRSFSKMNTRMIGDMAPYVGLLLVIIIFGVLTGGNLLLMSNLKAMTNDIIVTGLLTIGAVFVFGAGYFDMSLGGCVCFGAVLGGMTAIRTGSLLSAFLVILGISVAFAVIKGLIAAYVNVPFFIFTIILSSVITAVVLVIMGTESTIYLKNAVTEIPSFDFTQMSIINVASIAGFYVLCLVIFNYSAIGVKVKMMGGNMKAARQCGMNTKVTTILLFVISSLSVAIAAFIILIRTRTVGSTTATSIGTDVMVALVLGGMPLSGGPRSKISAGVIGAATITVLNSGLTIMGLTTGQIQICRGAVFIVVVLVSSLSYRSKLLPR